MKLLVVGDSLSDGLWKRDPEGVGSAWPGALRRLVPGTEIVNRSRGGDRSVETLDLVRALPESDLMVDAAALLVGANDLWRRFVPWNDHEPVDEDDFRRNLARIAHVLLLGGVGKVWILSPCVLDSDPDHEWNREMIAYRDACRSVAGSEGCGFSPVGEEFLAAMRASPQVKWTYDGVHPRPVGHERIAWSVAHHLAGQPQLPPQVVPPAPSGITRAWP
jgi:lysophospholipase L1-like esterase